MMCTLQAPVLRKINFSGLRGSNNAALDSCCMVRSGHDFHSKVAASIISVKRGKASWYVAALLLKPCLKDSLKNLLKLLCLHKKKQKRLGHNFVGT